MAAPQASTGSASRSAADSGRRCSYPATKAWALVTLNVPPDAKVLPHDPLEYLRKMRFHQKAASARDYGLLR